MNSHEGTEYTKGKTTIFCFLNFHGFPRLTNPAQQTGRQAWLIFYIAKYPYSFIISLNMNMRLEQIYMLLFGQRKENL